MPVNRTYITPLAYSNAALFQALNALANHADSLEKAVGVQIVPGTQNSVTNSASAPSAASWAITAGNGHFLIQITNPSLTGVANPVQHQIESAVDQNFDANSAVTAFTLGVGQATLDVIDPGVTKYFRLRSRLVGSGWNSWRMYATSSGVVSLTSGALKTS